VAYSPAKGTLFADLPAHARECARTKSLLIAVSPRRPPGRSPSARPIRLPVHPSRFFVGTSDRLERARGALREELVESARAICVRARPKWARPATRMFQRHQSTRVP
jgi:hypothetical protein